MITQLQDPTASLRKSPPRYPLIRRLGWFHGHFQLIVEEINLLFLPETVQQFLRRPPAGHCDYANTDSLQEAKKIF